MAGMYVSPRRNVRRAYKLISPLAYSGPARDVNTKFSYTLKREHLSKSIYIVLL